MGIYDDIKSEVSSVANAATDEFTALLFNKMMLTTVTNINRNLLSKSNFFFRTTYEIKLLKYVQLNRQLKRHAKFVTAEEVAAARENAMHALDEL